MNAIERLSGMTVYDLIQALRQFDQNAIVVFASDYGDRSHTNQVQGVWSVEPAGDTQLYETPYSDSGVARNHDDFDGRFEEARVVVLSTEY